MEENMKWRLTRMKRTFHPNRDVVTAYEDAAQMFLDMQAILADKGVYSKIVVDPKAVQRERIALGKKDDTKNALTGEVAKEPEEVQYVEEDWEGEPPEYMKERWKRLDEEEARKEEEMQKAAAESVEFQWNLTPFEYVYWEDIYTDTRLKFELGDGIPGHVPSGDPEVLYEMYLHEVIRRSPLYNGDHSYWFSEYREYKDHLYFKCGEKVTFVSEQTKEWDEDWIDHEILVPREEGKRFYEFECSGKKLRWDFVEKHVRNMPVIDEMEWDMINQWVYTICDVAIKVEKAYAEQKLSKECLEYAVYQNEDSYVWSLSDGSGIPVLFELRQFVHQDTYDEEGLLVMDSELNSWLERMQETCNTYCKSKGLYVELFYTTKYRESVKNGEIIEESDWRNDAQIRKIQALQREDIWTLEEN